MAVASNRSTTAREAFDNLLGVQEFDHLLRLLSSSWYITGCTWLLQRAYSAKQSSYGDIHLLLWQLFKNAGEDLMQLFDLSVISKTCNTCEDKEDKNGTLPSSRNRDNGHYSLPLAMLLYRLANRLSHSQVFILLCCACLCFL